MGGGLSRETGETHPVAGAVTVPASPAPGGPPTSVGVPGAASHVSLPGRFIGGLGPLHIHRGHLHGPADLGVDLSTDAQRFPGQSDFSASSVR